MDVSIGAGGRAAWTASAASSSALGGRPRGMERPPVSAGVVPDARAICRDGGRVREGLGADVKAATRGHTG